MLDPLVDGGSAQTDHNLDLRQSENAFFSRGLNVSAGHGRAKPRRSRGAVGIILIKGMAIRKLLGVHVNLQSGIPCEVKHELNSKM